MNNIDYIKEQNHIVKYLIPMWCVIALIVLLVLLMQDEPDIAIEPLSQNQQLMLIEQLGIKGFKETLKNGCYNALVEKIQMNMWSDGWCQSNYQHLKLNGEK